MDSTPDPNGIAAIMDAADSIYAVLTIFLIGVFLLLWKFGNTLLELLRENTRVTEEAKEVADSAHAKAQEISEAIVTNHGSKNLGDAVDRLTELVWQVEKKLDDHIAQYEKRASE